MLGISLLSNHLPFQTLSCKFLVHQNACFVGLYFFEGQNEYPWFLPLLKTPISLKKIISANSISTEMQEILIQTSTDLEMEARMSIA